MKAELCVLPMLAALWFFYFSLIQIAQVFKHQSDAVLLEAGFIVTVFLAPIRNVKNSSKVDKIGFLMIRWFIFR